MFAVEVPEPQPWCLYPICKNLCECWRGGAALTFHTKINEFENWLRVGHTGGNLLRGMSVEHLQDDLAKAQECVSQSPNLRCT